MAILIPDACPSGATVGEKRLYALLRDVLPDHFTCWYEPVIQRTYPDFMILANDFGLVVLEVKGWYAGNIVRANDHEVELKTVEGNVSRTLVLKNPIRQAREYLFRAMDELARPEYAILHQAEGEYRGKLRFPCGYGAVFTNINRAQLDTAGLSNLFPPESVLCRDELGTLALGGGQALIDRLKRLFPTRFAFDRLTTDQVNTVRGVIHREVIVKARPATSASVAAGQPLLPGAVALDVLDARQEQVARSLGDGHRLLFGVAGSGKTTLLLARARMLAERDSSSKILVLCYNKALARFLDLQIQEGKRLPNVEVRTFHSWAARKSGLRKHDGEIFEDYERRLVDAMLRGNEQWSDNDRYDAILIDEAHDFTPSWFRCITGLLKSGSEGDLLIAADGAQNLYDRDRTFTWKSVGVDAKGRTRRLSRCYRNTKEILEFAWQVAQVAPSTDANTTHERVIPTKVRPGGSLPIYLAYATNKQEHEAIVTLVNRYRSLGIAAEKIAILYARNQSGRIDNLARLLRQSHDVCWFANESDQDGGVRSLGRSGVRLSTIHAAKGLEFDAVILTSLDQLPDPRGLDKSIEGNLLYVGLTRAIDHLAVTWTGQSEFTDRVLRSTKATRQA